MRVFIILLLEISTLWGCGNKEYRIYVSLKGNDSASGNLSEPVTIYLSGGSYRLNEPLELGYDDGGIAEAPVQWKAVSGEQPVISGGMPVNNCKQEDDGTWSAVLPAEFDNNFRSLYINGKPAIRARFPDNDCIRVEKAGKDNRTNFFFRKNDFPKVKDTDELERVFLHDWSITRIGVRSIDWTSNHLIAVDSIGARLSFFSITGWEEHPRYYLENAREFCDNPGEWYCDFEERKIYYHPLSGQKISETEGVIPEVQVLGYAKIVQSVKFQKAIFMIFQMIPILLRGHPQ